MVAHAHDDAASPWIVRFAPLVRPGGAVLDLACGGGRHARFLAARSHPVDAVDRDADALAALAGVAGVTALVADLERDPWPFPDRAFDAVVVTRYLHRPLFRPIRSAIADGGVLLYETYMRGQERLGRPSRADFLLEPGELLAAFPDLTVVAFEQGRLEPPLDGTTRAVVQRICAVRGVAPEAIALP